MRALLALVVVCGLPMLAGVRWFAGTRPVRLALGGLLGTAALGLGGILGGLLAVPGGALTGGLAGMAVLAVARPRRRTVLADADDPGTRHLGWLVVGLGVLLVAMAVWRPVAGYDGWAIWSLKAKGLAEAGSFAAPVFTDPSYAYSHPDYPPLLPALQATAYQVMGTTATSWPLQVHLAWLWTGGGLALAGLVRGRGAVPLLLALSWVAAPHVVRQAISGYADVPMALLLVAGAALLVDEGRSRTAPAALLLAGAAATKSEGLAMALLVVAAVALLQPARRGAALAAGAGVLAAMAPWALHVVLRDLPNDIVGGLAARPPTAGLVLERLPGIFASLATELLWLPRWGVLLPVALLVLVRWAGLRRQPLVVAAGGALLLLVAVYAVTPHDVEWHVGGSIDRVVTAPLGLLSLAAGRSGAFGPAIPLHPRSAVP